MSSEKTLHEERIIQLETELKTATDTLYEYKKMHEEFILIASHDLQAPLRKLATFVERLVQKFKEAPIKESTNLIERILITIASMRSMIEGLVTLSFINETKDDFQKCDLTKMLQNILKDQLNISEKKVSITCSSLPNIEGNCTQLKHLFQNLINNSIKFQKNDTPLQINIDAREVNEEEKKVFSLFTHKKYYNIQIGDNGIGFEDQYAEKIFLPFQRLHGNAAYEGNGLGLAICKKIMEKHNGIIYAEGSTNSGARFILILPEIAD